MSPTLVRPPSRPTRSLTALAIVLATVACGRGPANATDAPEPHVAAAAATSVELGIAGRLNQFPSLAAAGSHVAAAWASADAAGVTDIYVATSEDAGMTFGEPVRVNDTPGDARANGEQPPRVALVEPPSGPPHIVVFWLARRPSGSVLLTARSSDGGRTFADAVLVAGTDAAGNRGWHALDVGPDGAVHLAWLDHRRTAVSAGASATPHHHTHTTTPAVASTATVDTVAMAQRSDLYFAGGVDDAAPRALTAGVCYCCKTAMVHGPDGAIHLAWRHVYPGNMRDIAFTTSRDGGRTFSEPVRVSEDQWSIAGCPDDGPAMTVDGSGRVHVVWPTVVTFRDGSTQKTLFHAMTTDGRAFTPRVAIPYDGAAHHPQVAATGDGSIVVAWDGHVGDAPRVFRARGAVDANGVMQFAKPDDTPVAGRYPAVVSTGTRVVTAWIAGQSPASSIRVATSEAR